jgi:aconitate hydratase
VVAYALAGSLMVDLTKDPLGTGSDGQPVYLRDIWPTPAEVQTAVRTGVTDKMFRSAYRDVFKGDERWAKITITGGQVYDWDDGSTYVRLPPYFDGITMEPDEIGDIEGARLLAMLGDSVTTDHISPAGSITKVGPAATYFMERQIRPQDFNSYGSRRGNHEVMMRGTFANIRLRNELAPGTEGGWTRMTPEGDDMSIYDAATTYRDQGVPLLVIGGKEYGTGSSRDWAAKGTNLLGVKAVIAESFERIHRSNLVGMGVLPLVFKDGVTRKSLKLKGSETFDIKGIAGGIKPRMDMTCTIHRSDGTEEDIKLLCRIDTLDEVDYYRHGGILHYVLRQLASQGPVN